jgi:uracil-DNA glycosylase
MADPARIGTLEALLTDVRACALCAGLPLGPRPILQASAAARILIAGQAPGRITHHKGVPFDDPSGNRLREWLGVTRDEFYDSQRIAIIPMGFCFPGTGKGGDFPPRPECAPAWRGKLLALLPDIQLTLVIGQYAQAWHLPKSAIPTLTERVRGQDPGSAAVIALPHPSPRNGMWLKANPWFAADLLPVLKMRVAGALSSPVAQPPELP